MIKIKQIFNFLLILSILLLTNCGFHPRGVILDGSDNFEKLKGTKFYIKDNNNAQFANAVRASLKTYKAIITNNKKSAKYIINLKSVKKDSQLTGVIGGASNNTYQLIYRVTYDVIKPHKKTPLIKNKTLNASQFWQSNASAQFAQDYQAQRIYTYLENQLVNNMINQIATLLPGKDNKK